MTGPMPSDPLDLDPDPMRQLAAWLREAEDSDTRLPNAMSLATVNDDGAPSLRMVLLRGIDERGLVFFTNRDSRKGRELAVRPRAALCLYWESLDRQVRIEGGVEQLPDDESRAYFADRPRGSQLSAWASQQSRPLAARAELEARVATLTEQYAGQDVPLPPFWGGYRVLPDLIEFWESRPDRLHERLEYRRSADGAWDRRRLQP
jgi:pyridoxamine 5'-phosphate oxidase